MDYSKKTCSCYSERGIIITEYTKTFKSKYKKIFKSNPFAANLFMLFKDLANEKGHIVFSGDEDERLNEISSLMDARFNDVYAYQLDDDPKK